MLVIYQSTAGFSPRSRGRRMRPARATGRASSNVSRASSKLSAAGWALYTSARWPSSEHRAEQARQPTDARLNRAVRDGRGSAVRVRQRALCRLLEQHVGTRRVQSPVSATPCDHVRRLAGAARQMVDGLVGEVPARRPQPLPRWARNVTLSVQRGGRQSTDEQRGPPNGGPLCSMRVVDARRIAAISLAR